MSCPEDRISAWIDGELDERDARAVDDHVAGCGGCRALAASFASMARSLRAEVPPDPGFVARFRERRDDVSVAPWWTWRQLALRLIPLAAVMLVAAIASLVVSRAPAESIRDVEQGAIGAPVAFDNGPETVLRIAFEPFPDEIE